MCIRDSSGRADELAGGCPGPALPGRARARPGRDDMVAAAAPHQPSGSARGLSRHLDRGCVPVLRTRPYEFERPGGPIPGLHLVAAAPLLRLRRAAGSVHATVAWAEAGANSVAGP